MACDQEFLALNTYNEIAAVGTLPAAAERVQKLGGETVENTFVMEIGTLNGCSKLDSIALCYPLLSV